MVQQMMPMDIEGSNKVVEGNRKKFKHIGRLKDSGANVAIIFRTVPDEPNHCLVIGPKFLDDTNHNAFMKALESQEGQALHQGNYIKKMLTKNVVVTMGSGNDGEVSLDELNKLIAKERGVKVSELAVQDPTPNQTADATKKKTTKK